jgi:hypothetical protein
MTRPLVFVAVVPLLGVRATFWEFVVLTVLPSWPGIVLQVMVAPSVARIVERQRTIGPPVHRVKE